MTKYGAGIKPQTEIHYHPAMSKPLMALWVIMDIMHSYALEAYIYIYSNMFLLERRKQIKN